LSSDEDKIDAWGQIRSAPFFKPQRFSRELFYSSNYINHLTTHHADTIRKVGGWRSAHDGAQDYDLILRSLEVLSESSIHHIPLILYHWRMVVGSTALNIGYKPYAIKAGRLALAEHLKRSGIDADVTQIADATYRVRRALPRPLPKVSILIPFRDQRDLLERCVTSIFSKTSYKNFEVILVNNGSSDSATLELLDRLKSAPGIRIIDDDRPFNYSRLNNLAAVTADGEYLCLLNNDTEVITEGWLDEMLSFACVPEVGCVGALLLYPNRTIQHAGVVLGIGGVAGHVFLRHAENDPGYFGRLLAASNYSAVTGACMMLRRSTFFEVGGLDAQDLTIAFNDIDLCIKVQARGYRNVVTPFAKLIHLESASRGSDLAPDKMARFNREADTMRQRYGALLENDPCYSPNLSLNAEGYSIRLD
jgi:GT2 family glycosyltransferase